MPAAALTQAVPFFEAWNAHDAGAVTAALADGGTYADPTTEGPLACAALAEHARGLFGAFPDLNFEVVGSQPADAGADGTMVVQWLMRGTNTGPWNGQPPTGRPVAIRGVDVFTVDGRRDHLGRGVLRPADAGRAARLPDAAAAAGGRPVPVRLCRPGLRGPQQGPRCVQPDLA